MAIARTSVPNPFATEQVCPSGCRTTSTEYELPGTLCSRNENGPLSVKVCVSLYASHLRVTAPASPLIVPLMG